MEVFVVKEEGVRQDCTALEPGVLCSKPSLSFIEHVLRAGGFVLIIANPGNNSCWKATFVGGTEVRRPDCKPLNGSGRCSAQQTLVE